MLSAIFRTMMGGMAALTLGAVATPASAAYYAYPKLVNASNFSVTLSSVDWSGSYNPQIMTTIPAGGNSSGTFKTVQTSGYSTLHFKATINNPANPAVCYFDVDIQNSTGNLSIVSGSRLSGSPLPTCAATSSGTAVLFTINEGSAS